MELATAIGSIGDLPTFARRTIEDLDESIFFAIGPRKMPGISASLLVVSALTKL